VRRSCGQRCEGLSFGDLDADEVVRRFARPAARDPGKGTVRARHQAAVLLWLAVRDGGHRDQRAGFAMSRNEGGDVEIRQRVAIRDEERGRAEQRQGLPWPTGRSEHGHLPRIAHAYPDVGAVPDNAGQGVRKVVQVQDRVGDAGAAEGVEDSRDQRNACHRKRGLGADE
jgi:hypothetical protein